MKDPYDLPAHPDATELPLDEASLDALAASIQEVGLQHPIIVLDGQVVDGRRRLRACQMAGVRPRFVQYNHETMGDVTALILALNAHRRDHDHARDYLGLVRKYLRKHHDLSDRRAAAACNVSPSTVGRIRHDLERSGEIPVCRERKAKGGAVFETDGAEKAKDRPPEANGAAPKDGGTPPVPGATPPPPERPRNTTTEQTLVDCNGREIPRELRDVFADDFYARWSAAFAQMEREAQGNRKNYFKLLTGGGFEGALKALVQCLAAYAPHSICPDCNGAGGACANCQTQGWLTHAEALAHLSDPFDEEDDDGD